MCVEHESNGFGTDGCNGSFDLFRQGGVLIVDQKDAIFTCRNANVSAGPHQHVNALGHPYGFDFNLVEIFLAQGRVTPENQNEKAKSCEA